MSCFFKIIQLFGRIKKIIKLRLFDRNHRHKYTNRKNTQKAR